MRSQITNIETLIEISKYKSFTKAADSLGISGPAVSKRIDTLESHLKKPVINRSTRKVVLTPFGLQLINKMEEAFEVIDNIQAWAISGKDTPSGTVHVVSFDETVYDTTIAPYISEFRKKYPTITIAYREIATPKDLDEIKADVIWGAGQYAGIRKPGLVAKPITTSSFGIFASPRYLKKYGQISELADLKGKSMISYSNRIPADYIFHVDNSAITGIGGIQMDIAMQTNRGYIDLAAEGHGVINCSWENQNLQNYLNTGELVPVLKDYWINDMSIYAFYDVSHYSVPHVRTFIDFFYAKLESHS